MRDIRLLRAGKIRHQIAETNHLDVDRAPLPAPAQYARRGNIGFARGWRQWPSSTLSNMLAARGDDIDMPVGNGVEGARMESLFVLIVHFL